MTALGFAENAKMDGQKAIVHTVGASNLGQMLVKICQEDGLDLVNIVRKDSQVELLKGLGAKHVVNSSDDDFMDQLRTAIDETDAFYGFDPIGGGTGGRQCIQGDGASRGQQNDRVFALWLEPGEAHVHLWPSRFRTDFADAELWLWLDAVGLAAHAVPATGGHGDDDAHAPACTRESHHHLCQQL